MMIKELLKKKPGLYSFLSDTYNHVFGPIKSGHLKYYLQYSVNGKKHEIGNLKSHGLVNIRPIMIPQWRIGHGRDGAHRRYYSGIINGEPCFIKIGYKDATVRNELNVMMAQEEPFTNSPALLGGDLDFDEETVMLAIQFIPSLEKLAIPRSKEEFDGLCQNYLSILDDLKGRHIIHADIHKENLMLQGSKLILLDYGISMMMDVGNDIDYISRPGTYYTENNDIRTYDDAYSFIKTVEELGINESYKECISYQSIMNRIGDYTFQIKVN